MTQYMLDQKRIKIAKGVMLSLFLCLTTSSEYVGSFVGVQSAQAQGSTIRAIKVVGNKRVQPETIRSYLQFQVGDKYNDYVADESLKALFATGLFSNVKIRRSGSSAVINVVENPIVNKVAFEGNSEIDDKTLASEVQLKIRSIYTRAKVQSDVQRILDVYQHQGRFAAQVEPKIIKLNHNRVNLVFEISEGSKTTVSNINFIGNSAFTDSQLRDVVTTSETGWLSFMSTTNIYDPDRLNLDREMLRQHYIKNGYADARVVSGFADLDRDGGNFFISFTVEEGALYNFGDIQIESSLRELDPSSLQSKLLTVPGAIYNASKIEKTIEALTLAAAEQGFAFARVRPRVQRDTENNRIHITYHIEQGQRVYIERIDISGNARTKDYVLRREFRLVEGDAYNKLMVRRARRRLMRLGFFKKVDIKRTAGSAHDRIVLNVIVTEQSTGDLGFSGGYSSNEGVVGEISITERNLMGNGQFLRLKLSGSMERAQIDLSFTEPRFLDRNLSAGFDVYHKILDNSGSKGGYKSDQTGGALRLGFPLTDDIWMNTRYKLYRENIHDVETAYASTDIEEGVSFVSSAGYTVTYDTRNHRKKPTRGLYLNLSQDLAGIGGDVNYIRSNAEFRAYYPATDNITLVARAVGGHVQGWGGDETRNQDLFRRGGETVRGFKNSGFGPRSTTSTTTLATDGTTTTSVNNSAAGGEIFAAGTLEARFPLPLIPENLGLSGAIFADAGLLYGNPTTGGTTVVTDANGNVITSVTTIQDDVTIRASIGASLLWDSPLGPLRADFAYVLTEEEYDETEMFRFGASTKF